MDLKFKGKNWVGNIYQKFEAMCQEVDDFVSQDTVKYVEKRVQTVGKSVKKVCFDVVQDLFPPPLVDPFKHEAQAMPKKQNDAIETHTRSMIGIKEKPVNIDIKQSSIDQDPIDPLENCRTSSFTGLPTDDLIEEADSHLFLGQDGDTLIYNNADMGVEGNGNLSIEQYPIDPLENHHTSSFTGLCPVKKLTPPSIEDVIEEADSHLSVGQDGDTLICKDADMGVEGNGNSSIEQDSMDPLENCHISSFTGLCTVKQLIPPPTEDLIEEVNSHLSLGQDGGTSIRKYADMRVEGSVNSSVEQDPIDPVENCNKSSFTGLCSVKEFIPVPTEDPIQEADSHLSLGQDSDTSIRKYANMGVEGSVNSSMEQNAIDPLENCNTSSFTGHFSVKEYIPVPTEDPIEEADSHSSLGQDGDTSIRKDADMGVEGSVNSSMEQDPIDPLENCNTPCFTELCSVKEFITVPTEDPNKEADSDLYVGQDCDALIYKNGDMGFEDNVNLDIAFEDNVMKEEQSQSEDLSSPKDKNFSEAPLLGESIDENHNDGILAKVSSATSANSVGIRSSQKEGTVGNGNLDEGECVPNIYSTLRSCEQAFSSCENKVVETALSSSSLSTESCNLLELPLANFPQKAGEICYDPIDAIDRVSDLSSALSSSVSFPTVACDRMDVDMGHAFSSSIWSQKSNDAGTSRIDEAVFVAGSSGNKHVQCGGVDDSSIDIAEPSMETIDLSDKVKLDESCLIVDSKLLYAVPSRARSYKKLIQDAFYSRKRITKEYEQLAIWYGDFDIESSQHLQENKLPWIANMSLESKKSSTQDLCDSEWELL